MAERFDRPAAERLVLEAKPPEPSLAASARRSARATARASATLVDPRAHAEYVRGRYYWNKRAGDDYRRASNISSGRSTSIRPMRARIQAWPILTFCRQTMWVAIQAKPWPRLPLPRRRRWKSIPRWSRPTRRLR